MFRRQVQERALNAVPDLCETIDYAEVSNVLFPRVAVSSVFSHPSVCPLKTFSVGVHQNKDTFRENRNFNNLYEHGKDA